MPRSESVSKRSSRALLPPELADLTGMRSSKPTFYAEYRLSEERLTRTLRAMDRIAQELTAAAHSPAELCGLALIAAADHVGGGWACLVLQSPGSESEMLACGPERTVISGQRSLPASMLAGLQRAQGSELSNIVVSDGFVSVPVAVEGDHCGTMILQIGDRKLERLDITVLRILGNHMSVAVRASRLIAHSDKLRQETETLFAKAAWQAGFLAERNKKLEDAQNRLVRAHRREILDEERRRLARELHDSVAQHVLSAGMAVEWCRTELELGSPVRDRLDEAKDLIRIAVERLRAAIYALVHEGEADVDLAGMLIRLRAVHGVGPLDVKVRIEGRPILMKTDVEHSMFRVASEALFNTLIHAQASRVIIRLTYGQNDLRLSVSDDGGGDPEALRRVLRARGAGANRGYHHGLANMNDRVRELGGRLRFGRARLGGIRVEAWVPLPAPLTAGRSSAAEDDTS